ncbi:MULTISPECIES: hypothetical protein [Jiangella]|uniref:Uncharacterized protein n=1 Tax=Jiangella alba TaxID=561176 RepID=A0A1H5GWN5_9ACTN|nr:MULTISPECIES: hypothetical protein [Jiangella]SDS10540.1 hypothetical protein SAMN04515669_0344 [Jiangella sp. DSM 45060]SEE19448.1 hypothetical protein SAMN04488561_0664 [Jiangella alba]
MSAQNLFGTPAEQAALSADVAERAETTEDGLAPIVIASIIYCPSIIAASYGFSC